MTRSKPLRLRPGKNDLILLIFLTVFIVVLFFIQISFSLNKASIISVEVDGQKYGEYSLNEDQVIPIEIKGKTVNVVTIENGSAYMSEATCPDKLCIKQGSISSRSQSIVCLPNRVIVTVTEGKETEIDSMSN